MILSLSLCLCLCLCVFLSLCLCVSVSHPRLQLKKCETFKNKDSGMTIQMSPGSLEDAARLLDVFNALDRSQVESQTTLCRRDTVDGQVKAAWVSIHRRYNYRYNYTYNYI